MKVLMLGGSNSRNSGGVFVSAINLGKSLHNFYGIDVEYLMYNDEYSEEDRNAYDPLILHTYHVLGPRKFAFSLDMLSTIEKICPDLVHTQSLWLYLSLVNKNYQAKRDCYYVISPHGMLDAWQLTQSAFIKKAAFALYERRHIQEANCLHALCWNEYKSFRNSGFTAPVAIIPNGIELPSDGVRSKKMSVKCPWNLETGEKTILFLGRIHQKKGIDNLLMAWAMLSKVRQNWKLVIAGETKDIKYLQHLSELCNKLETNGSVNFIGGQFGVDKEACYLHADAFILPSFSEGLPMAVLEAWSYELPVIITSQCNLPEGFEYRAALEIEPEPVSIKSGLEQLIRLSDNERKEMGRNGFALVKAKFTWESVAQGMSELYAWIAGKSTKPNFVYLD